MIVQGSPEWHGLRLGKVTASRVSDVVARTKSGYGASRANYAAQLVCERLTGEATESFTSAAMMHGLEQEPFARDLYAFRNNVDVEEVAFVNHPKIDMAGASPDGLVAADGLVEFKCPITATHIDTLRYAAVPGRYVNQIQWQLACTGRAWCDFVSFDPRMPEEMRLFVQRINRDDQHIASLEAEVRAFLDEIDETIADLKAQYMPVPVSSAPNVMMAG